MALDISRIEYDQKSTDKQNTTQPDLQAARLNQEAAKEHKIRQKNKGWQKKNLSDIK